ncbi:hypothetical protein ACFLT9_01980 [Acidobacteriota bacterium]
MRRYYLLSKVFFLSVVFLGMLSMGFSVETQPEEARLAVVHAKGSLYLMSYTSEGKTDLSKLPFYYYWGVIENNQTLYTLISHKEGSLAARYDLRPEIKKTAEFTLDDKGFRCLFVRDRNLYLGSKDLWHIDFTVEPPVIKEYEKIPPDYAKDDPSDAYMFKEKTIDAFALSKDTLFVADNVMQPIYLLRYNIADPRNPVHIETRDFGGGPNERVTGADADEKHFLLFRVFSRLDGFGSELDVYEADSLNRITTRSVYNPRREESAERKTWHKGVLAGGKVFVAADREGLGSFVIAKESPFTIEDASAPCVWLKKDGRFLLSLTGTSVVIYTIENDGKLARLTSVDLPETCTEIW